MSDEVTSTAVTETVSEVATPSTAPAISEAERVARSFMAKKGIQLPGDETAPSAPTHPEGEQGAPQVSHPVQETPAPSPPETGASPELPPPRPISAKDHYQQRRKQRELKEKLAQAEARMQGMQAAMEAFQQGSAAVVPEVTAEEEQTIEIPDIKKDPKGHIEARFALMQQKLDAANEKAQAYDEYVARQQAQARTQEAMTRIGMTVQQQAQAWEKENPGYLKRADRLIQDSIRFHQSFGVSPEEAGQRAQIQFQAMIAEAIRKEVPVPSLVEEAYQARFGEQDARAATLQSTPVAQVGQDPHVAAAAKAKAEGATSTISSNGASNTQEINARNAMTHGLTTNQAGELLGAGGVRALSALHEQMLALQGK